MILKHAASCVKILRLTGLPGDQISEDLLLDCSAETEHIDRREGSFREAQTLSEW
jgi:hypothetical protein